MPKFIYVFVQEDQTRVDKIRQIFTDLKKGKYGYNEPILDFLKAFGKMPVEKFTACFETYQKYQRVQQTAIYSQMADKDGIKNKVSGEYVGDEEELISKFIRILDDRDPETLLSYLKKDLDMGNCCFNSFKQRFPNATPEIYENVMSMERYFLASADERKTLIVQLALIINQLLEKPVIIPK
jgi:hypothetical protein